MKLKCLLQGHDYEKDLITTTKSLNIKSLNCSEFLFERLINGVTTIIYKCKHCNKLKVIEMLGYQQ